MPLIPLPTLSYPVDTNFLYEIIRGLNVLSDAVTKVSGTSYLNGKTYPTNAIQTVTTSISVVNNQNVNAGETRPFTFDYPDFAEVPTISTGVVVSGANTAARTLSVVLQTVTPSKVNGIVRFGESGIMTVNVNLIIVGVSPTYKR